MDEYVNYLYLEYLNLFGAINYDDPLEIVKEELFEKLDEEEKKIFNKLVNLYNKRNAENIKRALHFGFYNAKQIFK